MYSNTSSFSANFSDLNMILAVGRPNKNDYNLTSAFFGSYTISGVTYGWEKTGNWDVI
jgi:hypothetical protein